MMSADVKITDRSFDFTVHMMKLFQFLEKQDRIFNTWANDHSPQVVKMASSSSVIVLSSFLRF